MSESVQYIEIDIPRCSLTYGETPCTADLGVTGDKKCFNSRKTCQDLDNYDETTETVRFATGTLNLSRDIIAIPNIRSISYTPSKISLGESIGARAVLSVNLGDHPTPDTGPAGDYYRDSRSYDPYTQGTFWAKFQARFPYMRGHALRWYIGNTSDSLDSMEQRSFIIDKISGPNTSGVVQITAKDPLTLIDDQRAKAPRLSRGVLDAAIDDADTSLTLSPEGIGDEDYPSSGYVAIGGSEIVAFTRTDDTMTITRAQYNTDAQDHDAEDRVQLCIEYDSELPSDILFDLLTEYGNVPEDFIPLDSWDFEVNSYLGRNYTALIAEPVEVKKLVNEILQQAAISIWWDELANRLRLQVLRDVSRGAFIYSDDFILEGSFSQERLENKRVSQVWTYYGQINPLEGQQDPKNYRNTLATVSLESETNYGEPAIKTIFSRWITQFGKTSVERLNNLLLARYSDPPRRFSFELLRDSGIDRPSLGGGSRVESFFIQDDEGLPVIIPTQFVQIEQGDATWKVQAEEIIISEEIELDDPNVKNISFDSNANNVNLYDAFLQVYAEAVEDDVITFFVSEGVVVGSDSAGIPAIVTGDEWPSGATVKLVIAEDAYIVGRGGEGGLAKANENSIDQTKAGNGQDGGLALKVESDIEIENNGVIGGGGGGGAGAAVYAFEVFKVSSASSGGGGAGYNGGDPGPTNKKSGLYGSLETGGLSRRHSDSESGGGLELSALTRGGNGGDLGEDGGDTIEAEANTSGGAGTVERTRTASGGSAGVAVDGDSMVTWTTLGDVRGARTG